MPLTTLTNDIASLKPLVSTVRLVSGDPAKFANSGIDVGVIEMASGGAVVLMVARFEQFLKDIGLKALDYFGKSNPPVGRSSLPENLQVTIMSRNMQAAMQKMRHGSNRSPQDRMTDMTSVAKKIVTDEVWGGHAIETHSNPGPETVREILGLLSIDDAWAKLEAEFKVRWQSVVTSHTSYKSIPKAADELGNVLGWRNSVAHTSSIPANVRAKELEETAEFLLALAQSIDHLVSTRVRQAVQSAGSIPATW